MKNIEKYITAIAIVTFIFATGFIVGESVNPNKNHVCPVAEPVVKYVEVVQQGAFDTSVIESNWCGGFTDGTVRMVGAWWYADGVVEDEQGQLWAVEQSIEQQDFLLLWIADNNTPNNTTDDLIIKVWREAY